ncbi:UNVERIFIED_CONTAM: hypothetical protein FKN15_024738 [Acipenser sinensis]
MNSCPNNCSGHGKCTTGNSIASRVYCECDKYWKGEACDIPYCKNNCGSPDHGYCDLTGEKLCVCNDSWQGPDCSLSVPSTESYWVMPNVKPFSPSVSRTSHKTVMHGKFMWVIGGYTFNYSSFQMVLNKGFVTCEALSVQSKGFVTCEALSVQSKGFVTCEALSVQSKGFVTCEALSVQSKGFVTCEALSVQSKGFVTCEALSVQSKGFVTCEALSVQSKGFVTCEALSVQSKGFVTCEALSVQSKGFVTCEALSVQSKGFVTCEALSVQSKGFVACEALSVQSKGFVACEALLVQSKGSVACEALSAETILKESGLARYLHSAVILSGVVLVFGGNTHNDTALSNGAKCFSSDFIAYDIACDEWKMLPKPSLHRDVNRFGHSAVISNGKDHSMLVSVVSFRRLPQHASVVTTSVLAQFCGSLTPVVQVFCVYLRVQHRFKRACDEWKMLPKPSLHRDVNRFGHSAVISNGSMFVFGGFSSVLLNDILVYKLPNCEAFSAEEPCLDAGPGIRCLWDEDRCVSWDPRHTNGTFPSVRCPQNKTSMDDRCYRYTDCASCTANTNGCQWCEDKKCISASSNCTVSVKNYTKCHVRNEQICTKLTSCKSCSLNLNCQWDQRQQECHALPAHLCGEGWSHVGDACLRINASRDSYDNAKLYCYNLSGNLASLTTSKEVDFVLDELHKYTVQKISPWVGLRKINISYWGWEDMSPFTNTTMQWQPGEPNDSGFCAYLEKAEVAGLKANPCTAMADGLICEKPVVSPNQNARPCKTPCSLRTTCSNCTSQGMECMWCSSAKRCVDSNAYVISFPYGQCLEWQTGNCLPQNCSGLRTCSQCLEQPGCGWCNDPSNTGKGQCIEGSSRGPMKGIGKQSQDLVLDQGLCPKDKSFEWAFIHCPACQCNGHSTCVNSSICEQCKNLTTGKQCEACMAGYYGDPTNGGKCQELTDHSVGHIGRVKQFI